MNIPRIFANAIARRIAYVLVAAILAATGIGTARAQAKTCLTTADQCTRAEAHAACMVEIEGWRTYVSGQGRKLANDECRHLDLTPAPNGRYTARANSVHLTNGTVYDTFNGAPRLHFGCPPGRPWDDSTKKCGTGCEDAPPLSGMNGQGANAFEICHNECRYECGGVGLGGVVIDGSPMTVCTVPWTSTNSACSTSGPGGLPGAVDAPTDTDGDGTSDGNDTAPNNPGQGGAGDENGDGPEDDSGTCGGEGQPTCGSPGTGSGNGNTSGGGGDCDAPPRSTGDAILAQIAFQTWATRCAIKGLANAGGGSGDGDGEGDWDGDPGPFPDAGEGDDPDPSDYNVTASFSPDVIDTGGFSLGATCPTFGSVTTRWGTVDLDANGRWCQVIAVARVCLLLLGGFIAIQILMGRLGI